jgi:hypothetical protein
MAHTIRKREGHNLNVILNLLLNIAKSIELMKRTDERIRGKLCQTYTSLGGPIARTTVASYRDL